MLLCLPRASAEALRSCGSQGCALWRFPFQKLALQLWGGQFPENSQLQCLWDLPQHLHRGHTLPRQPLPIARHSGVPKVWPFLPTWDPCRAIFVLDTCREPHCSPRPLLSNPPSFIFSCDRCQTHSVVWRLSLPWVLPPVTLSSFWLHPGIWFPENPPKTKFCYLIPPKIKIPSL